MHNPCDKGFDICTHFGTGQKIISVFNQYTRLYLTYSLGHIEGHHIFIPSARHDMYQRSQQYLCNFLLSFCMYITLQNIRNLAYDLYAPSRSGRDIVLPSSVKLWLNCWFRFIYYKVCML